MKINSIEIAGLFASGMRGALGGTLVQKNMVCLSVGQATIGSYAIGLDGSEMTEIGTYGVYIAPAECRQKILHIADEAGIFEGHWMLMDVRINHEYRLEELFRLPKTLPDQFRREVAELIEEVRVSENPCRRYIAAYRTVEILLSVSEARIGREQTQLHISGYVRQHCSEPIRAADIAAYLHCSPAQVYRKISAYFHMSPSNYINMVRLTEAADKLEHSGILIKEIAMSVGFDDVAYFSRLFKKRYGRSPTEYRRQYATESYIEE